MTARFGLFPRLCLGLLLSLVCVTLLWASELVVLSPEGAPVSGADVEIIGLPTGDGALASLVAFRRRARTNDDGIAFVELPALDRLLVLVDAQEFPPSATVISGTGKPMHEFDMVKGKTIRGQVDFGESPPSKAGRVCASWEEEFELWAVTRSWRRCAELPAEGRFAVSGIPERALSLSLGAPGFLPAQLIASPEKPVQVVLKRGFLLKGQVLSAEDGKGVAGARVAENKPGRNRVVADETGSFEIAISSDTKEVLATAKHFKPGVFRLPKPFPADPIRIDLPTRETVSGTLLSPDFASVNDPVLWMQQRSASRRLSKRRALDLDEKGYFLVDLPGTGEYSFLILAENLRSMRLDPVSVGPGERVELGTVELAEGAVVTGLVLSEESGEPVAGAEVLILEQGPGLIESASRLGVSRDITDEAGAFRVAGMETGAYQVRVRHELFALATESVVFDAETTLDLGTIWLRQGSELTGRVMDRRDRPREGLVVELTDPAGSMLMPIARAMTDPEGRFGGMAVGPGKYRVRVLGQRVLATRIVEVSADRVNTEVTLVINSTELSGVVRRGGVPVAGGYLKLAPSLDPGHFRGKLSLTSGNRQTTYGLAESVVIARVDEQGRFEFDDAPSGLLWASYMAADGSTVKRSIRVPDAAEVHIQIEIEGLRLSGRVVDAGSGTRVVAEVRLVQKRTAQEIGFVVADAEGLFRFDDLEPETYSLQVAAEGYRTDHRTVTVDAGTPPVEIALSPGEKGTFVVRLLRRNGTPASGSMLTLLDESGLMVRALPTDVEGVRVFEDLPFGDYFLAWSDSVGGAGVAGPFDVSEANETIRHEQILFPGSEIGIFCEAGECSGARLDYIAIYSSQGIELSPYLSGASAALSFSDRGELQLGRLSPGRYWLRVGAAGREWQEQIEASGEFVSVALK